MKSEFKDIFELKSSLWELRLEDIRKKKSEPWKMTDILKATKSLKKNQSRDPNGYINEIFHKEVMGSDLKKALLFLMNGIKFNLDFPREIQLANITSIYKNKGSRLNLENDRGIFIVSVLRKILDKLIYEDKYEDIESEMSDSNIGARRGQNIRNHLFIVYGIINSVLKEEKGCIDLQIYDLIKAFDSLWLEDCLNDICESLPEEKLDDKIAMIYESNVKNLVAVNTAVGQTDRADMPRVVMQGGTFGPLLCSNSIDKLGKKSHQRGEHTFLYKKLVRVMPLSMTDDVLGLARCGFESLALNSFINVQIEMKKLKFHTKDARGKSKCHKLHIGTKNQNCPELEVHGTEMEQVSHDTYLGDIISHDGKNEKNLRNRVAKGTGIMNDICNMLEKISLGKDYFKIALLLRESQFLNGILTNAEVWYALSKADIEQLEELDRQLLRKIMHTKVSVPSESLYLELGCLNIGTIIKARRINYLQYLLKQNGKKMLNQFFSAQWKYPGVGDWTEQVKEDLVDFGIDLDLEQIRLKSFYSFKKIVQNKAKEYALGYYMEKAQHHSKMDSLFYAELELQDYLKLEEINVEEAWTMFAYRTRMAEFGENYRNGGDSVPCPICHLHLDNQVMALKCTIVRDNVVINGRYEEIFNGNITKKLDKH